MSHEKKRKPGSPTHGGPGTRASVGHSGQSLRLSLLLA